MRFTVDPELELFAESVRGAIGGWEAPLEPAFGVWQDDRDDALAARLEAVGWSELWSDPALLGPAVAGGSSSAGPWRRSVSSTTRPSAAPLAIDGRVRHGEGRVEGGEREATLDGTGTVRGVPAGRVARSRAVAGVGSRHARLPRGPRRRCAGQGGRARPFARAIRSPALCVARRAGPARRRSACARRPGPLRLGRSGARRGLPGGDPRLGRRCLSRGDRARPAGSRRRRLRSRGRHPSLLPAREERAGVGAMRCCRRCPRSDGWGSIVTHPS